MKKILMAVLLTLGLSTAAIAENPATEGTYTAPDSSTLDFNNDYAFAMGIAQDYNVGLTMQFKQRIDVSIGIDGAGVDFIFFRYNFMKNSKFFSKRPLNFYVAGGAGYLWEDYAGMRQGALARLPIGADWKFAKHWGVYLSAAPAVNFQESTNVDPRKTTFEVMGTLGVRFLF